MKRLLSKLAVAGSAAGLYLASASAALAYDYSYSYDSTDAAAGLFGSGIMIAVWCCFAIIGLGSLALKIWMLVHAIQNAPEDQKTLWIVLLILDIFFDPLPIIALIYFFTKKKEWSK